MSKPKVQPKIAPQKMKNQDNPLPINILSPRRRVLKPILCLSLMAATFAVFEPVRNHTFLNIDDNLYITDNTPVKSGLTFKGVIWAFTTMHAANWHPLTWLSHMLDCQLYGLNPSGHHLTNLFFHIASALLLFLVLERMTGSLWRSSFVAALFALHPLHVESVAWVAERKDVLSTFFWMLTMWAHVRYVERPKLKRYLLVLLSFTMGLLSKPMLVTLPFVLLLIDYWPLKRFQFLHLKRDPKPSTSKPTNVVSQKSIILSLLWEKVPFFILSAGSSVLTFFAQQRMGAVAPMEIFPFEIRIANALISYIRYIEKMVWPHKLAVFYPHPVTLPLWKVIGAGLLLVCVSILVIRAVRKHPYYGVGWFWYLGTLVPVIGLIQVGAQAMADRYTYLPLIGLFIMIAWGVPEQFSEWRYRRIILSVSAGIVLLMMMMVTRLQIKHWQNDLTLYEHSLAVTSDNYFAHTNLGVALSGQGKIEEAISHYTEALRISPYHASIHCHLGVALAKQGKIKEAIAHYTEALRIEPDYAEAHNNLGAALVGQGKIDEAMAHYAEALRIDPRHSIAHYNMGIALGEQGKPEEAIAHFNEAIRIKPDYALAHHNLGIALARQGRIQEAIPCFKKTLQISPDYAEAHLNLGFAYLMIGDRDAALKEYKILKAIHPDFANMLYGKIFR
jgi:tetratricopeptide (TPR) repeat protein